MEDGESWLGNDFWWGVTVGKKTHHFCEGKPINLHYPPQYIYQLPCLPSEGAWENDFPLFFWKVEISKQQL